MQIKAAFRSSFRFIVGVIIIFAIALSLNLKLCRSGYTEKLLSMLATPHSGEDEVLPERILPILRYLRANHIKSIKISGKLGENRFIFQPLTESAYPIVVTDSSNIFVSYSTEELPTTCGTLKVEKGIRIAHCR